MLTNAGLLVRFIVGCAFAHIAIYDSAAAQADHQTNRMPRVSLYTNGGDALALPCMPHYMHSLPISACCTGAVAGVMRQMSY